MARLTRGSRSDYEWAEELAKRKLRLLAGLTLVFIAFQGYVLLQPGYVTPGLTLTPGVKLPAFIVWAAALLFLFRLPGGFLRLRANGRARDVMSDEAVRARKLIALEISFWVMVAGGAALYLGSMLWPIDLREALHLLITVGVGTCNLTYVGLELRAGLG